MSDRAHRCFPSLPDWRTGLIAMLAILLSACAPTHVGSPLADAWVPSPNAGERRPDFIILHHTGSRTAESARRTLTSAQAGVSAHYLLDRDGALTQLVDERLRAWHAGDSRWGSDTDINSASIGIELVNDGEEPFPAAQIDRLIGLLQDLIGRYHLPARNVLGHADVAPRRKVDPSRQFPWATLGNAGFGLWCNDPGPSNEPGDRTDPLLMLQAIGYDMRDPRAAFMAWRRHYRPELAPLVLPASIDEASLRRTVDEADRARLRCLLERATGKEPASR